MGGWGCQPTHASTAPACPLTPPPPSHPCVHAACLEAVELDYLLGRGRGWDQVQNWQETLSGGEKQRLAMARLLFHHPRWAGGGEECVCL